MRKRAILFLWVFAIAASARADLKELLAGVDVPEPQAFKGWFPHNNFGYDQEDPFQQKRQLIDCATKTLYPTHPQQNLKKYHALYFGKYKERLVSTQSSFCKIKSTQNICLSADSLQFALVSDTYRDRCGQTYRGYWVVVYQKKDETMGTLTSKGRTTYADPNSNFLNDMKDGFTYAVEADDFLFLSAPFKNDQAGILQAQKLAHEYTHSFDPKSLLFQQK